MGAGIHMEMVEEGTKADAKLSAGISSTRETIVVGKTFLSEEKASETIVEIESLQSHPIPAVPERLPLRKDPGP